MTGRRITTRILAIDPCTEGFGFAVLEDGRLLVEWGVARVWGKSDRTFHSRVEEMILRFRPSALVLEDVAGRRPSTKVRRIRQLVKHGALGVRERRLVGPQTVRRVLGNPRLTKHGIASLIASHFPEIAHLVPPPRRPWMAEDRRMHVFDAVGLAIAGDIIGEIT